MVKNVFVLVLFVLAFIALIIILIKKNNKDRKGLFKKLPGDYPDPTVFKSEFDSKD